MNDRRYAFFGTIDWCFRACHGEASARAFGKMQKFKKAEIDALLADYLDHQANPSPMVHLTQHQLDAMLRTFRPMPVPDELSA